MKIYVKMIVTIMELVVLLIIIISVHASILTPLETAMTVYLLIEKSSKKN